MQIPRLGRWRHSLLSEWIGERLWVSQHAGRLRIRPAGGFRSLWKHWGNANSTDFRTQDVRSYTVIPKISLAQNTTGGYPALRLYVLENRKKGTDATTLIQQQEAPMAVLQNVAVD